MTVANGREFLSIPGPTNVPDAVLAAMQRPAIDIYSGDMLEITRSLHADLSKVFRTDSRVYIYAANGHGGWEAALSNVLSRGETVLVLESGLFAVGWGDMAKIMGVKVDVLKGDLRRAVSPEAVTQRLEADTDHEIKAILVVQIDTASGVVNDIPAIRRAIDAARHPALLMVDAVASLGCMPFEMDAWGVDVAMSGSQKGLMTPPGLAFVAGNERAHAAHQKADLRTRYWDWTFRDGEAHYQKYGGTPPEHLLFGLRKALDLLLAEGLDHAARRHALLAEATRQAVDRWAEARALAINATRPAERASSITCVLTPDRNPQPLLDYCRNRCGVVLGVGIGPLSGRAFRIAHMGHVNAPMVIGTLGAVEMGLTALGIPHGAGGVQRAVDYLSREVAA
ncbi:MAG TPA: aminotransferase class V-fold PLP-dependent enzyme [Methylomirabilota bacterium]|jgi:alanine-glyoxylate transaminase/serine-glyoxylate transaminase/serine-pyruvate transaminase|nr:aminotransferase class V-fold PLP-dependent enzyme [Methylomirabilota bacterium]